MFPVSVIIPAFNEEARIVPTLKAIKRAGFSQELIVIDDGSIDQTYELALKWADKVIRFPKNKGKSAAVWQGAREASQPILVFLDADLGESAALAVSLLPPVIGGEVDMTIATLPATKNGGFGLVKRLAQTGIYRKTGQTLTAPLSGQRAIKRDIFLNCYRGDQRFGIEVGLTLDCLQRGYAIQEVEIPFTHRELGKSVGGFVHRFKQGIAVYQALRVRRMI